MDRLVLKEQLDDVLSARLHEWGFSDPAFRQSVVALVDGLKTFREEGRPFRPDVYVIRSEDGPRLQRILASPGNARAVQVFIIEHAPNEPASYLTVLKSCAPLAVGEWNIVIRLEEGNQIAYGLMRRPNSVIDETAYEQLRRHVGEVPPFLLVRALAEDVVELTGRSGESLELHFWGVPKRDIVADQTSLVRHACRDVPWPAMKPRIQRLLSNALRESSTSGHGFLAAVQTYPFARSGSAPDDCPICVREMQTPGTPVTSLREDGVFFTEPIPLALRVAEFVHAVNDEDQTVPRGTIDSYAQLRAWQDLVTQCLATDGIVLFDSCARLLGYRIFVRPASEPPKRGRRTGARKRAFNYLRALVENGELIACFYQSQDGATEMHERG